MRLAVNFFQSRSGLPVTGVIDAATEAAMDEPRCGNPASYGSDIEDKWARNNSSIIPDNPITYAVDHVPSRLGEFTNSADILTYIQISLDRWAARTNLTFQRNDNAYDFIITFANIPCTAPCNQVLGRTTASPLTITLNTAVNFDKSHSAAGCRNGVTSSNPNGTSWTQVSGPPAQDIAVGREGAIWMTDKLNGIYERHQQPAIDNSNPPNGTTTDAVDTPAIDTWEQVDGEGTNISVGMRSLPWVTGMDLSLWGRHGG
jgi:hypothetical protein